MGPPPRWAPAAIWILSLGAMATGLLLLRGVLRDRPVQEATVSGLSLRLDRAEWLLDQMDHGDRFPMPESMMPDLPPHGVFRLTVEVSLHNPSDGAVEFRPTELFFRSSERGMWPATGGELAEVRLAAGKALNMFTHFDVAENEIRGDLRLIWVRDGRDVQMLDIPHPPEHDHELEGVDWPDDVLLLGPGDPARGRELYFRAYACMSCHGDPAVPDSHTVGPPMEGIGSAAARRVPGKSAPQYLYEAILAPDAFIAPDCKGRPCDSPSAMPPFGDLVRREHMPDLVAYLLAQRDPS